MNIKALCIAASAFLAICGLSLAVQPASFDHSGEGDFATAELANTAVNSLGEVTLSRKISVLLPSTAGGPAVISAVAVVNKFVCAGSGTEPAIYIIEDGKPRKYHTLPGTMVCCMAVAKPEDLSKDIYAAGTSELLLVGTGGDKGGLFQVCVTNGPIAGKISGPVWSDEKVKYIWAVVPDGKGGFFVATGPNATIYAITPNSEWGNAGQDMYRAKAIYTAPADLAKNFTCLARSKKGLLYAGTDKSGLVFEIDPAAKTGRVILDADEKEISSIVVDENGAVYAATSDESKAVAEGSAPSGEEGGHPESATSPASSKPSGSTFAPADSATHHTPSPKSAPATRPSGLPAEKLHIANPHAQAAGAEPGEVDNQASGDSSDGPPPDIAARISSMMHAVSSHEGHGDKGEGAPGNAVYRISPDGLVQTIFRKPVTILAMIADGDDLVLATGNGGEIYRISKDGQTAVRMAAADAKQVTALAQSSEFGRPGIIFATANKASVGKMETALAASGTMTSKPQDAKQVARWGALSVRAQMPQGSKVLVSTRSGNLSEASDKTWSQWSPEKEISAGLRIESPAARFIQYRLKLVAAGDKTPVVHQVEMFYQVGNLSPSIQSVTVSSDKAEGGPAISGPPSRVPKAMPMPMHKGSGDETAGASTRMVQIKAADPNDDQLIYSVFFRQLGTEDPWVKIADKLKEPQYAWDTKTVGDGTYEIKVVASDSPANPPATALETSRVSSPVIVDNTPPVIASATAWAKAQAVISDLVWSDPNRAVPAGLDAEVKGTTATISGVAIDANRIAAIHYSVDSQDEWVTVLPTTGICDSPLENFTFMVKDLKPGPHRIAVRATDQFGNMGYASVSVTIK